MTSRRISQSSQGPEQRSAGHRQVEWTATTPATSSTVHKTEITSSQLVTGYTRRSPTKYSVFSPLCPEHSVSFSLGRYSRPEIWNRLCFVSQKTRPRMGPAPLGAGECYIASERSLVNNHLRYRRCLCHFYHLRYSLYYRYPLYSFYYRYSRYCRCPHCRRYLRYQSRLVRDRHPIQFQQ
jgi:hypothetical protein